MPTNHINERFERDEAALGARIETFSPMLIDVYGQLGFDFAWLDFEHGGPSPYDSTAFEPLVGAAQRAGVELLVRLPSGDPPLVHKILDTGVKTVLIPRIETAEEVQEAVQAAHFIYDGTAGDRGWGVGANHPTGEDPSADGFIEREDESVLVGVMIEHRRAVENIDAILAVPELGFAFIGANDLSISLDHPREKNHSEVRDAIETVERACIDANVPFGAPYHDTDDARAALDAGHRILRVGDEVGAVRDALGTRLDAIRSESENH
jgi:2-keto-3-deoxy-L-rhamnonate aldolase RhmA